ncbi:MAG: 50S ribosomal protein L24 [Thermoplasmata archaeon]|nr:50S ribosomal protein L24 [Thermoplasmata archaeon]
MSVLSPHSPRRQRKAVYDAPTSQRRILMTVPLSRELRRRFHRRSIPVRKGDTVRVMSGSFSGREERVAKVDRRGYSVTLDNVTLKTGESKLKPLAIRTSHLVLTKLNLADAWRRQALQVAEGQLTPEELGEEPEVTDEVPATSSTATPETKDGEPEGEEAAAKKPSETRPARAREVPADKESTP